MVGVVGASHAGSSAVFAMKDHSVETLWDKISVLETKSRKAVVGG